MKHALAFSTPNRMFYSYVPTGTYTPSNHARANLVSDGEPFALSLTFKGR